MLPESLSKALNPDVYQTMSDLTKITETASLAIQAAVATVCNQDSGLNQILHHVEAILERAWYLHEKALSTMITQCEEPKKRVFAKVHLNQMNLAYQNALNPIFLSDYGRLPEPLNQVWSTVDDLLTKFEKVNTFLN